MVVLPVEAELLASGYFPASLLRFVDSRPLQIESLH